MNRLTGASSVCVAALLLMITSQPVDAGLGKLIWKGLSSAGRGASKAGHHAGSKTAGRVAGKSAAGVSGVTGRGAGVAARTVHPLVTKLGPSANAAVARLSPAGTRRLTEISSELAKSPYRNEWLQFIARSGDQALDLIWSHKGSIAVMSVATAAALQPKEFLEAGEQLAEASLEAAGRHLVKPLVETSAKHVAAPMAQAMATKITQTPWAVMVVNALLLAAGLYGYRRWKQR